MQTDAISDKDRQELDKTPNVASQFYANDKNTLPRDITQLYQQTIIKNPAMPAAIIAPHAGYINNTLTAAIAYRAPSLLIYY